MNFLDIIIPQYKEDDQVLDKLLSSINEQRNVDFNEIGIILINDCSNVKISKELIASYPKLRIDYLRNEKNIGPGLTRQYGIDHSNAKYVTFVDADDELYNDAGLQLIIGCLKETNADLVQGAYIGQRLVNGLIEDKKYDADYTSASLHAKFIKRDFLIKNNIRFSDKLGSHFEDSYFSIILTAIILNEKNVINVDYPIYYWKYNENSITRKCDDVHYYARHFDAFVLCPILVYDFLKDKEPLFAEMFLQKALIDIYVVLESDVFKNSKLSKIKENYEKELIELVLKYKDLYYNVKKEDFFRLFLKEKNWYLGYLNIRDNIKDISYFLKDNNIFLKFKEE